MKSWTMCTSTNNLSMRVPHLKKIIRYNLEESQMPLCVHKLLLHACTAAVLNHLIFILSVLSSYHHIAGLFHCGCSLIHLINGQLLMQQPVSMFCLCGLTVLWGIGLCILGSVRLGSGCSQIGMSLYLCTSGFCRSVSGCRRFAMTSLN